MPISSLRGYLPRWKKENECKKINDAEQDFSSTYDKL